MIHRASFALVTLSALVGIACSGAPAAPNGVGQTTPSNRPEPAGQPAPPPVQPPVAQPAPAPAPSPNAVSRRDTGALLLEGTPALPKHHPVQRYLNLRSASLVDLSDKGDKVLVATRFGNTAQIHLVEKPLGMRKQLTFAAEPISSAQFVPGTTGVLTFTGDIGGSEQSQIYRLDLATGKTGLLTDGKSRNGSVVWSRDGKRLAWSGTARNKRDFDIWISDGKTAASAKLLVKTRGAWFPLDFSRDGKKLLISNYISAAESSVHLVDVATGAVTRITPAAPKAAYSGATFKPNGAGLYITTDREGEFRELYEVSLDGKKWRSLTRRIPWDVGNVAVSSNGALLAFTTNEDGWSKLHVMNTFTRRTMPSPKLPRGVISGVQFARKANVLAFTLHSGNRPADAYTYNVYGGQLRRWTDSETGGIDAKTFLAPSLIKYKSFDGAQIPAFYYRPPGKGPFPVLIMIHGGPEAQARPYLSGMSQYLLREKGVAILQPNVRGSRGYGKTYLSLDNGFKREDSVKDIGALLDWIATRPELNAKRVGVAGGSYGGYMVLASLMHYSKRIVAGVDVVGISNFVTFLKNTRAYRRDLRRVEYGDERDPKMRAHLEKISPTNNVGKIASALFVAQGANDPRVPASEAEQIVKAVRKSGRSVWYMLARNEGHGFRKKNNRDVYSVLFAMFFEQHLLR